MLRVTGILLKLDIGPHMMKVVEVEPAGDDAMVPECHMPGIGSTSKLVRQIATVLKLYTRRCIVFASGSWQQAQDGADAGHSKCYEQKEPAQHCG